MKRSSDAEVHALVRRDGRLRRSGFGGVGSRMGRRAGLAAAATISTCLPRRVRKPNTVTPIAAHRATEPQSAALRRFERAPSGWYVSENGLSVLPDGVVAPGRTAVCVDS